jgi:2,3,4,5-tetrahydropyridine-2-carboxylate N-succinyltransferase
MPLREEIEALAARTGSEFTAADRAVFDEFKAQLNRGEIRAAERQPDLTWSVNTWVKQGILLGFRMGQLVDMSSSPPLRFFDKDTYPVRPTTVADNVRIVPGGSSIRDGAYVDEGTMIDSHALVGSCAQIGKRVHLSAAAQIGGVLEPVGAVPVVIEDDVLVGGGCGVYEGTIVHERAVLAAGTILTGSTPVYDLAREKIYQRTPDAPLEIPASAVVVPGSRSVRGDCGQAWGLSLYAPVIVKYRDEKTERAVQLEDYLR